MKLRCLLLTLCCTVFSPYLWANGRHIINKVTEVHVFNGLFFVKGESTSGAQSCPGYGSPSYGTLHSKADQSSYDQMYTLALSAYHTGKGVSCYVYDDATDGYGCLMQNCTLVEN